MDLGKTEVLDEVVGKDTDLKKWLVEYVGDKEQPEDNNVTVEMIVNVVAEEFPDFLMAVAEENWVRGYHQGLTDGDTTTGVSTSRLEEEQ